MSRSPHQVYGELRRQISWRQQLIRNIDHRETDLARQSVALEKRRRRYQAKNNGLGRPAKQIPSLAKAEVSARRKARVEIDVLKDVLRCPNSMLVNDWILWLAEHHSYKGDAIAQKKLEGLRRQFSAEAPSPNARRVWTEVSGRAFLELMYRRQKLRLVPFGVHPLHQPWDMGLKNREWARLRIIESFLDRSDLSNLQRFAVYSVLIKKEVLQEKSVSDQQAYAQLWSEQVDWFTNLVKDLFVMVDR